MAGVTRLLRDLGAEDRSPAVKAATDALLVALGREWWCPADASGGAQTEAFGPLARELSDAIASDAPWVVGDLRLATLAEHWQRPLPPAMYVIVHGPPGPSAKALADDHGLPLRVGLALWEYCLYKALRATSGRPHILVRHEDLLEGPGAVRARLMALGQGAGLTGFSEPGPGAGEVPPAEGLRRVTPGQRELPPQRRLHEALSAPRVPRPEEFAAAEHDAGEILSLHAAYIAERHALIEARRLAEREGLSLRRSARRAITAARERDTALARVLTASAALLASRRWRLASALARAWARLRLRAPDEPVEAETLRQALAAPPASTVPALPGTATPPTVDVVVCVRDALDEVRKCLAALQRSATPGERLVLVDDGSGPETAQTLRLAAAARLGTVLLRNEASLGYTAAVNRGLQAATAPVVVLLNSDTVVTRGWLQRMLECLESGPSVGLVGPLSNAAGWQSVPEVLTADGQWARNPLPSGLDLEAVASLVARVSRRRFPRVPLLNGFCLMLTREVREAIGLFDAEHFAPAYGEETDYCIRAAEAGFELAVADHAWIFHAKSRSYAEDERERLTAQAERALAVKHGANRVARLARQMREDPELAAARARVRAALAPRPARDRGLRSVLYVLPVACGGGGVRSVVQDALEFGRLGYDARIAVPARHAAGYLDEYPRLLDAGVLAAYHDGPELSESAAGADVVVGTHWTSMALVAGLVASTPRSAAYYVQDYEPWCYPEHSTEATDARRSFHLVPGALLFAKTHWLCDLVREKEGREVARIDAGIDLDLFHPERDSPGEAIRLTAMVRPSTPRRAPARTLRVLAEVRERFRGPLAVEIFGCTEASLREHGLALPPGVRNLGPLRAQDVAGHLRSAHVFVDLSDYQAFGRTGLEAMASGCCAVLCREGGPAEYARHGVDALLVDSGSEAACVQAILDLLGDHARRARLRREGLRTASGYGLRRAALSQLRVLEDLVERRRQP